VHLKGHMVAGIAYLMRRFGFEWVFRLIVEPKRLWRRYLIGNLVCDFSVS